MERSGCILANLTKILVRNLRTRIVRCCLNRCS